MENYLTERYLQLSDGTFPHMGVRKGDVAPFVLVCGHPGRVERIKEQISDAKNVGRVRGYVVYTGSYKGLPLSIATHGIGGPSAAIAIEELGACGGRVFIRVGSCASIHPEAGVGSVIIATAAVRDEGTSRYYAPEIFPAVADHGVVSALCDAAEAIQTPYHVGIIRTTDSFYEGERKEDIITKWRERKVIAFEMEASTIFTIGSIFGYRCGTILVGGANLILGKTPVKGQDVDLKSEGEMNTIKIALESLSSITLEEAKL